MKPGDALICLFVNDYSVGDNFIEWPLHITIIPWFRLAETDRFNNDLVKNMKPVKQIKLTVGEEKFFGGKKKLVNLIKPNLKINALEERSRKLLKKYNAWIVDETTKVKQSFKPHITVQRNERLVSGDKLIINRVYIVRQNGENKEVIFTVDLNG